MDQGKLEEMMEFLKAIERKREANKAESMARREADKAESMANQLKMEAERKADKEIMARMEAKLDSSQERTNANLEEMKATIRSGQEETRAAINTVRSELEGKIAERMDYALAAADEQNQALREEVNQKLGETQQDLQASVRSLQDDITDLKTELETRIAEVVRAELGVGDRTGNDAGRAEPPKFDGSTSWAMFRRQFETVADHNHWTPREKAMYLITALQGRACDVLHGVPRGATYEEAIEALEEHSVSSRNYLNENGLHQKIIFCLKCPIYSQERLTTP
jgi:hypothetical protein